jgi:hypothetical protein
MTFANDVKRRQSIPELPVAFRAAEQALADTSKLTAYSKTGGRRFEPCHPGQLSLNFDRSNFRAFERITRPLIPAYLDLWLRRQYITATCCRPV